MEINIKFKLPDGDRQSTEAPRITDDDELNASPQNPISHDNQLETPDEETSTELCVIDSGSSLSSGIRSLGGRLSFVPANYDLMHPRQQQGLINAVDNISSFLQSMAEGMDNTLGGPTNIFGDLSRLGNILKLKQISEGQVLQVNSLTDAILRAAVGQFAVNLPELTLHNLSQMLENTPGEGEIQAANSSSFTLIIDTHRVHQGVQTTVQTIKYKLNTTHQAQRYCASFVFRKDVFDFSHEAFDALRGGGTGRTTCAVVEELD